VWANGAVLPLGGVRVACRVVPFLTAPEEPLLAEVLVSDRLKDQVLGLILGSQTEPAKASTSVPSRALLTNFHRLLNEQARLEVEF